MKGKIIPLIQLVAAVVMIAAVKVFAPVCDGLLDLANGNQTHMKCWFSAQAVTMIAVLLIVISALMFVVDESARKKMQIASIAAAIMMPLTFMKVIGMCMMDGMACHGTAMWVMILSAVIGILGVIDMIKGGKEQIPE